MACTTWMPGKYAKRPAVTITCTHLQNWYLLFDQACALALDFDGVIFEVTAEKRADYVEVCLSAILGEWRRYRVVVCHAQASVALQEAFQVLKDPQFLRYFDAPGTQDSRGRVPSGALAL